MTDYKLAPFPYQTEDASFIVQNQRVGILHEPGVGKTFSVLIALTYIAETVEGQSIVVIPPILFNEWLRKFSEYFDTDRTILAYKGTPIERKALLKQVAKADIVLVSYSIMTKELASLAKVMPNLQALVADEYKFIKSSESKAFKTFQKFAYKVKYLVLMNGTPVVKNPADLFPLIQLINPNIYVTKKNFLSKHAVYSRDVAGFPMIVNWKNLDILNKLVNMFCRRLLKKDVLDLPEKQLILKQFSLDEKHQKKLKEFWDFGFLEFENEEMIFAQASALLHKVRQALIDPSIIGLDLKSAYFDMLDLVLDEIDNEQFIIFCHYHSTSKLLEDYFTDRKISYGVVDGQVSAKNKELAISQFKSKLTTALLGNAKSMGVGLDLQHCRNVIYFELDYEVDNIWQGMDRVHRPGQLLSPRIFMLIAEKTPAVALLKSVLDNVSFVAEILKNKQSHTKLFEEAITTKDELKWTN